MSSVTSESIGSLAAALAKFQGASENITKGNTAKITSTKGSYSYTYADLGSILSAIRKPLSDAGLAVLQSPMSGEAGYELVTKVIHAESGEWAQSILALPVPSSADVKAVGSAITYARRYALISLLGLATDDDDGSAASEARQRHTERYSGQNRDAQRNHVEDDQPVPAESAPRSGLSAEKASGLHAALGKVGLKKLDHPAFASAVVKREIVSFKELTTRDAKIVYDTAQQVADGILEWRDGKLVSPPDEIDEFPPEPDVPLFGEEEAA